MVKPSSNARPCVLLVEDDPRLLRALVRVLEFDGFAVLCAADARSAQVQAREHAGEINVIVTDMLLPDQPAIGLANELSRACPSVPIVFMSGSLAQAMELPLLSVPTQFLSKPFSPDDLKAALHALHVT
jgi:DNA-binding response OmpR family regulator